MESGSFESKKRKICQEDEDEEEKIEKFCALVNTIREVRDRFIVNKKNRKLEEGNHAAAWKPSFQPEDFMQETDQLKKPTMSFATNCQTKEEETGKEAVKEGLDLTLSL
ncbi:Pectin lyase-like superfamily protein [Hibiscus syriacus]|uniref:Pectin lyase-like superfamily protein n=1 Tax=Hibiscus syriacus TaxID=106335 RepID=A0A6A3CAD2_HIBSY|nr:Pectin lyase-like superfamily protein [Hibiscus syriacus]